MKTLLKGAVTMTENIAAVLRETWDHLLGRVLIVAVTCGWLPFYALTRVQAALTE